MIIKKLKLVVVLWMAVWLAGCDGIGSIPPEKQDYVGTWYGQYMVLTISPDARVDYQYKKGSSSKSISAPINAFIGDDFRVGALGIDTTFVVSTPPYFEDGVWKMVVDDQLVMRKEIKNSSSVL